MGIDTNWFQVDKDGLAKLLDARGKAFAVYELIQNAWDTAAKKIEVTIEPVPGRPFADVTVVDDDPDGFADLSHAFTLFAESAKKADPEKRGRFNLGEKLVLAVAEQARIVSTKGGLEFSSSGVRRLRTKREAGTSFSCRMRMTREEFAECVNGAIQTLIPPADKTTTINGIPVLVHKRLALFGSSLPTVIADAEGYLRQATRMAFVELYEVIPGETATLYEMGLPVVETGDAYHVNVLQKVPLSTDRDSVPPSYLRKLRTAVVDHMHLELDKAEASATWAREALPEAKPEAVRSLIEKRFGPRVAAADPSDREAENRLKAEGYTIVHGGSMTGPEWQRVKSIEGLMPPAGVISPTHPEATAETRALTEDELTAGMKIVREFVEDVGSQLMHHWTSAHAEQHTIGVRFISSPKASVRATWGARPGSPILTFNVGVLGAGFFERGLDEKVLSLVIHEIGHHFESNHLSVGYYRALTSLGARLAFMVAENAELLTHYRRRP